MFHSFFRTFEDDSHIIRKYNTKHHQIKRLYAKSEMIISRFYSSFSELFHINKNTGTRIYASSIPGCPETDIPANNGFELLKWFFTFVLEFCS
jgi:hypothetical protein